MKCIFLNNLMLAPISIFRLRKFNQIEHNAAQCVFILN